MSKYKNWIMIFFSLVIMLSAVLFIGGNKVGAEETNASIINENVLSSKGNMAIYRSSITLLKGETYSPIVSGAVGTKKWTSSNTTVATVNSVGLITAKSKGTANIICKTAAGTVKCVVTVETPTISVPKSIKMYEKIPTKVTGTTYTPIYKSSDTGILKVSGYGVLFGADYGTATLTIKIHNKEYKRKVIVKENLKINATSKTLLTGEKFQAYVSGCKTTKTWSSSNKAIATVNSDGLVTAKAKGKAVITCKTLTNSIKLTVNVEKVTVTAPKKYMVKGNTTSISVTGTSLKPTFSSSDKSVVSISSTGKITAKGSGKAVVKAVISSKNFSYTVYVKSNLSLNYKNITITYGEQIKLKSIGASTKCTWSSSNTSVAIAGAKSGSVYAVDDGTATITCKTEDGAVSKCKVTVEKPSFISNKYNSCVGDVKTFMVSGVSTTPYFSSSDTSVISINQKGEYSVHKEGSATITIKFSSLPEEDMIKTKVYKSTIDVTPQSLDVSSVVGYAGYSEAAKLKGISANDTVTASSSNYNVCKYENNKVVLNSEGSATITLRSKLSGKSFKINVVSYKNAETVTKMLMVNYNGIRNSIDIESMVKNDLAPITTMSDITYTMNRSSIGKISNGVFSTVITGGSLDNVANAKQIKITAKANKEFQKVFIINYVLYAAHRGATYEYPENTLSAFNKAIEEGAIAVETDVYITKDGVMVCSHDPKLTVCSDNAPNRLISNMTLQEIKSCVITGRKDSSGALIQNPHGVQERVPTLEEALSLFKEKHVIPIIHLKDVNPEIDNSESYAATYSLLKKYGFANNNAYIIAGSSKVLNEFYECSGRDENVLYSSGTDGVLYAELKMRNYDEALKVVTGYHIYTSDTNPYQSE